MAEMTKLRETTVIQGNMILQLQSEAKETTKKHADVESILKLAVEESEQTVKRLETELLGMKAAATPAGGTAAAGLISASLPAPSFPLPSCSVERSNISIPVSTLRNIIPASIRLCALCPMLLVGREDI